ncbi:hypothetical protein D5085_07980 [Ectothiorhodospiraceae bacterium BW-2]|nr:hypothetical protein D5085_07980 [Ectothiorhodospiraceae bacterium BW-2]
MKVKRWHKWLTIVLLLLVTLAGGGLLLTHSPLAPAPLLSTEIVACHFETGSVCYAAMKGEGGVAIDLNPKPLQVLKPLQLTLNGSAIPTERESAIVTLTGINMEMGQTRFRLQRQPEGGLSGQIMLPLCSSERMDWLAVVELAAGDPSTLLSFSFSTWNE